MSTNQGPEKKQIETQTPGTQEKEGDVLADTVKDLSKVKLDQLSKNVKAGQDVSLAKERETGFAKPPHIAEAEVLLNQFTQQQKLEILKLAMEGEQLSEQQKQRIQQLGILKTALLTIRSDIKTSRTWGEWASQAFTEFEGTTNLNVLRVDNMIAELDQAVEQITADPGKKISQLVGQKTLQMLLDYDLDETVPSLMDSSGRLKEASSFTDLQTQYLGLVEFLRDRKDYASAQKLIEENLLGPQFAAKRNALAETEKKKARTAARKKILKMASSAQEEWDKQGLTVEQQNGFIDALVEEETKRNLNKVVGAMNDGLPFEDVKGVDKKIMESYKDMMGYGEWHNFSDESWDKIIEETIINAPLIIISGGAASVARLAISNGAKLLIASARLSRFGVAAARVARGVEATGAVGKAFYWGGSKALSTAGKAGGLLVEGTVFETVYSGLHGENLFEGGWEKFPEWGKRILWSSATLGVFHAVGAGATEVNKVILKHISKFPDKSIRAAIQKLIVTGSAETAAMLGIGAVQHYAETGEMDDWHFTNELFHALLTVGALKIAGGGIQVGKKKFFPPKSGPKAGPEGGKPVAEGANALVETALAGPEGLQRAIEMVGKMENLTLSMKEVLLITSKLPDLESKGRFLRACGEKMSPSQKLEFEGISEAPKNGATVPDVLREIGGKGSKWLIDTMRLGYAHGVALLEGRSPILVEGVNFATLDIAKGGERSLVFDLTAPGSARNADSILVSNWKSKSQAELCSLMNTQGIPRELVDGARASHAEIAPALQPFVRIIIAEGKGKGGGLEPLVFVDQQGIREKFGLDLAGVEGVLRADGIVMPKTLENLARETGVPLEVWETMTGLRDADLRGQTVNFGLITGSIMLIELLIKGLKGAWWLGGKGIEAIKAKHDKSKGTVGPDGKLIEGPKPESAHFQTLDEIMAGLKVDKLSEKLEPDQVKALTDRYNAIKTLLNHFFYDTAAKSKDKSVDPEVERKNSEMVLKILVEIEYLNLRLEKIHGVATTAPGVAGRSAAEIGADIKKLGEADTVAELQKRITAIGNKTILLARQNALLKGKPKGTKLTDLITELSTERDKKNAKGNKPENSKQKIAELQAEIDKIRKLGEDLETVGRLEKLLAKREKLDTELANVNKPKEAGNEQTELAKKLNALYEQLFGILTTGAVDVNTVDGSTKDWKLKKKWKIPVGVERGMVDGKIKDDIATPKTDLTPAEAEAALKEVAEVLKANQENFKRLKELEVAIMLGQKRYNDLKPIAAANDPTNPKTIAAIEYAAFFEKMMGQRDALCVAANKTGARLSRNPIVALAMKHKLAAAILITLVGITSWRLANDDSAPVPGQEGNPATDTNGEGSGDGNFDILDQVDETPPTPPSKGGGSGSSDKQEQPPALKATPGTPGKVQLSQEEVMRMLDGK